MNFKIFYFFFIIFPILQLMVFQIKELNTQRPIDINDDADIEKAIREEADTVYHPVGTCKMGDDDMSVVSHDLKVHKMKGLRVVDASIMPTLVGGNTNAPTIMIGEKASDLIINEWRI